jgi:tetratricopeptide (TPR) repeat protein
MRRLTYLLAAVVVAVFVIELPAQTKTLVKQLREAREKEREGDLDGAIEIYQQITANTEANQRHTAQAHYRIGVCHLRKGDRDSAKQQFERLVKEFPRRLSAVSNARRELRKIWQQERREQRELIRSDRTDQGQNKDKVTLPKGPPAVVRTTPDNLAEDVSPDLPTISVTFDRPMTDKNWSWTRFDQETFPKMIRQPRYDKEKKTCTVRVSLQPATAYLVGINSGTDHKFKSSSGETAKPYALVFATKDAAGNSTPIPVQLLAKARSINLAPEPEPKGNEGIEGTWTGALKTPMAELAIVFKIARRPDGAFAATLDSPDQGVSNIPADKVTFEKGQLHLEVNSFMSVFDGRMGRDSSTIKGQWKQLGKSWPLTLQRLGGAPGTPDPRESWLKMLGRELAHEDGHKKGKTGFASIDEFYVRFETPEPNSYLKAVRIFGVRPVEVESDEPNFHILVCDADFTPIADYQFPLDQFEPHFRDWVTLTIKPTKISSQFAIGLIHEEKALAVGYRPGKDGNSFFKSPRGKVRPYSRGNWLIRAIVSQSPEMPELSQPKWPITKVKLPEFEWPDDIDFTNESGPEKTVKLNIAGVTDDAVEDVITEKLRKMADPGQYSMMCKRRGDNLYVQLSPVRDVDNFMRKIDFGTVVAKKARGITVQAKKDWTDEDFRFGPNPDYTVNMMGGEGFYLAWSKIQSTVTADVAPVSDVQAFVKKIDFGTVTSIRGRWIVVAVSKTTE